MIKSTPSIFMYGQDKSSPVAYSGKFTFDGVNSFVCSYCDSIGYNEGSVAVGGETAEAGDLGTEDESVVDPEATLDENDLGEDNIQSILDELAEKGIAGLAQKGIMEGGFGVDQNAYGGYVGYNGYGGQLGGYGNYGGQLGGYGNYGGGYGGYGGYVQQQPQFNAFSAVFGGGNQ